MSPRPSTTTLPPTTLTSPPGTDIWRKPPTTNIFNAPTHPSPLPSNPLSTFHRARVTFKLGKKGENLRQYDQAGLVLRLTRKKESCADGEQPEEEKWIKTGIEFYNGLPYLSTVACDAWADWSILPLADATTTTLDASDTRPSATLEIAREQDVLGKSLWVYQIVQTEGGEEKRPLREVCWVFAEEEGWRVGVGGYVARPSKVEGEGEGVGEVLEGEFEGVTVEFLG